MNTNLSHVIWVNELASRSLSLAKTEAMRAQKQIKVALQKTKLSSIKTLELQNNLHDLKIKLEYSKQPLNILCEQTEQGKPS